MHISPIKATQYSFKGLFKSKAPQDPVIKGQGGKILHYTQKDDMLFVKDKPYTGTVRLEYKDGRKEHRDYENGRVMRTDINGDGNAKIFYAYQTLPNGQVTRSEIYEGDDGI